MPMTGSPLSGSWPRVPAIRRRRLLVARPTFPVTMLGFVGSGHPGVAVGRPQPRGGRRPRRARRALPLRPGSHTNRARFHRGGQRGAGSGGSSGCCGSSRRTAARRGHASRAHPVGPGGPLRYARSLPRISTNGHRDGPWIVPVCSTFRENQPTQLVEQEDFAIGPLRRRRTR